MFPRGAQGCSASPPTPGVSWGCWEGKGVLGMPLLKLGCSGSPLNFPWGAGSLTLETEVLEALWGCWEPPLEIGVLRAPFDPWGAGSATLKIEGAGDPIFFPEGAGYPHVEIGVLRVPLCFP